jgi:hypothetical protein
MRLSKMHNHKQVHYRVADGCAVEKWFDEDDIVVLEAEENLDQPIYVVKAEDAPENVIIEWQASTECV